MKPIGKETWVISCGYMPLRSTGPEPKFTSFNKLAILNAGDHMANIGITIYYTDRDPAEPYRLTIAPRRTRHVRFNDLIFPEAIPLETDFAALITSDVPVVVQFTGQDTSQEADARLATTAFADAY